MNRIIKISLLVVLVFLFMLIRNFEEFLFYDPLISFFKSDYATHSIPQLNTFELLANIALRFLLNTMISLGILWLLFKDIGIVKLASVLYFLFFVLLLIPFSYFVFYSESNNFLPLFYLRRFLIQPLLLLVLIPAFYFQNKN